jgi:hypothetical protein
MVKILYYQAQNEVGAGTAILEIPLMIDEKDATAGGERRVTTRKS